MHAEGAGQRQILQLHSVSPQTAGSVTMLLEFPAVSHCRYQVDLKQMIQEAF
jgi:hypothetical protein